MDYQKECQKLINDIKYKLTKLYLTDEVKKEYLRKLSNVERTIYKENDEFKCYEAFLNAIKIEKELASIIHADKSVILPPYEKEEYLKSQINSQDEDIKNLKNKNKRIKLGLLSYILTGSILLTVGSYSIVKAKNTPKEKLYYTEKKTYYVPNNTTRTTHEYEKAKKDIDEVIIKKITPWIIHDDEATREEYIYHISNMSYGEVLSTNDYEKIIANLTYEVKNITTSTKEMQDKFKYTEPIFEVTEISQNQNKYIEKKAIANVETISILFSELIVYLLLLKINEGPLFESILMAIRNIDATNKIIDSKLATNELLNNQYNILENKKKTLKKQ